MIYNYASQDPNLQQQQVDSMLASGISILILDPVDAKAIASSVSKAHAQGVKVVACARLATGPIDAYTSFDNFTVGKLQGEALLAALKMGGDPRRARRARHRCRNPRAASHPTASAPATATR